MYVYSFSVHYVPRSLTLCSFMQRKIQHTSNVFSGPIDLERTIFHTFSQFYRHKMASLLAFPREMTTSKRNFIFLVLINVLLLNCGCANARPNLESNLIDQKDKTSVRIKVRVWRDSKIISISSLSSFNHRRNRSNLPTQIKRLK